MKKYQIIHENKIFLVEGNNLVKTLISFCAENKVGINDIQSCMLIDEEKAFLKKASDFWEQEYERELAKKWYHKLFNL